ncbi:uncharacterized protein MONOS_6410 [Monocercomonoides exilis]|uniref:uncharacterized protein n=1 Tax=Monocercomonoides exilis TaxID=2049356 RepID=UPI00355A554B|nr:hypothetical protein MONOS_6410 [Monocercomonoides exilis]|eukprot:MONOS_6410.1-p1 / transcript=MONOS_6410.1 / gene=MONOS_6410 / organism=Monocercomonoides_exilis_PA203 / gene_product=unspecified product / transcript_product=unspecified product / location=Mono_scaffold00201:82466-85129(-) / protein_length=814 / sequence_SO=supercontig / SO=protein_coding / is_pseudo=false
MAEEDSFSCSALLKDIETFEKECGKVKFQNPEQIADIFDTFFCTIFRATLSGLSGLLERFYVSAEKSIVSPKLFALCCGASSKRVQAKVLRLLSWLLSNSFPNQWPPQFISDCWSFILSSPSQIQASSNESSSTIFQTKGSRATYDSFRWSFFLFRESLLARGLVSILTDLQFQVNQIKSQELGEGDSIERYEKFSDAQSEDCDESSFAPDVGIHKKNDVIERLILSYMLNASDTNISFDRFLPMLKSVKAEISEIFSSLVLVSQALSLSYACRNEEKIKMKERKEYSSGDEEDLNELNEEHAVKHKRLVVDDDDDDDIQSSESEEEKFYKKKDIPRKLHSNEYVSEVSLMMDTVPDKVAIEKGKQVILSLFRVSKEKTAMLVFKAVICDVRATFTRISKDSFSLRQRNRLSLTLPANTPFRCFRQIISEILKPSQSLIAAQDLSYELEAECARYISMRLCSAASFECLHRKELSMFLTYLSNFLEESPFLFQLCIQILRANQEDNEYSHSTGIAYAFSQQDARLCAVSILRAQFGSAYFINQQQSSHENDDLPKNPSMESSSTTLLRASSHHPIKLSALAKIFASSALYDPYYLVRRSSLLGLIALPVSIKGKMTLLSVKVFDISQPVRKTALEQLRILNAHIEWKDCSTEKDGCIDEQKQDVSDSPFSFAWLHRLLAIPLTTTKDARFEREIHNFVGTIMERGDMPPSKFLQDMRMTDNSSLFEASLRAHSDSLMHKENEIQNAMDSSTNLEASKSEMHQDREENEILQTSHEFSLKDEKASSKRRKIDEVQEEVKSSVEYSEDISSPLLF